MATQDWLSGGFTGRLGAMVGQRYNGKWYVHTYVPPSNPQTPNQQAVRARWKQSLSIASECNRIMHGSTYWDTGHAGRYAQMCGLAQHAQAAGGPATQVYPLLPPTGGLYRVVSTDEVVYNGGTHVLGVTLVLDRAYEGETIQEETCWLTLLIAGAWNTVQGEFVLSNGDVYVNLTYTLSSAPSSGSKLGISICSPWQVVTPYPPFFVDPYEATMP